MPTYVLRESPKAARPGSLLDTLLQYRGLETAAESERFLAPSYEKHLHDPFLMAGMTEAVARIKSAVAGNERILIYSDYDCDGIPAAVGFRDFFRQIGYANVEVYIPHRHREGFGLHGAAIDSFAARPVEQKPALLITLDCGITDIAEVALAREHGIDVIITDHHAPLAELPPALAVLDPKRSDCPYPFKELCGAGVMFKLVQALIAGGGPVFKLKGGTEKWLLDMVGLATLSDMVSLTGENRVLAYYGLMVLRKSRRPGLRALLSLLSIDQRHLAEDDIGFMIAPRINAASRMGEPIDAFSLLSSEDPVEAKKLASHLNHINDERKVLVASLVKEVKKIMLDRAGHFENRQVIVLGNPLWRPGILGLAANTLVESYGKPVFLWGRDQEESSEDASDDAENSYIKGSCRSDGSVDLVALMSTVKTAFNDFGGHRMSGGFSVVPDTIHTLEDALEGAYSLLAAAKSDTSDPVARSERQSDEQFFIDAPLTVADATWDTYRIVEQLAPFGVGNPKPLFLFKNVQLLALRRFGKANDHLELTIADSDLKSPAGSHSVKAIGFFVGPDDFSVVPEQGKKIDLVATVEKSTFRGRLELRLRIVDII